MSKLKVDTIEGSSASTITVSSGQTLNVAGTLSGAGVDAALAASTGGYDDGTGHSNSDIYYDNTYITSPQVRDLVVSSVDRVEVTAFHSLLSRKKFKAGVLTEVEAGCGEFFRYATVARSHSPTTYPHFNIGGSSSGSSFAITTAVAAANGYAAGTNLANTFQFGWFYVIPTDGSDQSHGLSRWIYDTHTEELYFVTGQVPKSNFTTNSGGGFWMWSEHLGWHYSRADIYPFFYISSPMDWTSAGGGSGPATGWAFWKVANSAREKALYLYGSSKWVDPVGTGVNAPLNSTNPGISGSGQPASVPSETPGAAPTISVPV